jgi:hypothetical protein
MKSEYQMPNAGVHVVGSHPDDCRFRISNFGLLSSFVIRHSDFECWATKLHTDF